MTTGPSSVDWVRLEIIKNALLAITDEMSGALQRSAYSTNIKTRGDFSCALLDCGARVVAQSFSQPTHLGSLVHSVPSALFEFGADRLREGDALIMNDPHRSAVHLNDIAMISPIDVDGQRAGYVANVAHHVDVGGSTPGSLGINREIYQEGLVIPPIRLASEGQVDEDLIRFISANIRSPSVSVGDFRAQLAANRLAVRRARDLCDRYSTEEVKSFMSALIDYSDRRVTAALADFPEGVYSAEDFLDNDGISDEAIRISVKVTVADSGVEFDLTDSADQVQGPMNATAPMAYSGIAFVLKSLLPLDIPTNGGFYQHVRVKSRPGTVVHALHPAAVAGGWEVSFRVTETAFKALGPVFEGVIPADTKGVICNVSFGGRRPDTGVYYAFYETIAGGYGAHTTQDGMDGVQPHIHNTENAPIEEIELHYPVRFKQFSLIPDSGGAGRHRGGLGVRRDYWFDGHEATFSIVSDRGRFAPQGLDDGRPGRLAHYVRDPDGKAEELKSKATIRLAPGEVVSVQTPGGGGAGNPRHRPPEFVAADVRLGKVSTQAAIEEYWVVVDEGGTVDEAATEALRSRSEA